MMLTSGRLGKRVAGLLVFSIFALSILAVGGHTPVASAETSATTNCPPNAILNMTSAGGVPASFNLLGQFNYGGFAVADMANPFGVAPVYFPNGTLSYDYSATDWVKSNSNYTVWMFNVKPGLKWSDGTPATAQDILTNFGPTFALNATVDPVGASALVEKEYAANASEAVYVLNQPYAHFDQLISAEMDTQLYSPEFISHGAVFNGFGVTVPSLGPFYIHDYTSGDPSVVLLRNPYFTPLPGACEVIVNFVESTSQVLTPILAGQSDYAVSIDQASAPLALKDPSLTVIPISSGAFGGAAMMWNVSVYPYDQLGFRQALVYGINQSGITQDAFFGYSKNAYNAEGGVPVSSSFYNPNQMTYSYNPTKALDLLHSLGYTTASDNSLHYPNGTAVNLKIFVLNKETADLLASGDIQSDLAKLGINTNLVDVSIGDYFGAVGAGLTKAAITFDWNPVSLFGSAFVTAQPICLIFSYTPCNYSPTGEPYVSPPAENAAYWSNVTALDKTDNQQQITTYIDNIQAIQAQYLPFAYLQYGSYMLVINHAKWTNTGSLQSSGVAFGEHIDPYSLAELEPVSTTTTTTTPTTSSSTSITISTTSTSAAGGLSSGTLTLIAGVVIIVIVIAVIAAFVLRRKPTTKPSTSTEGT